MNVYGNGGGNGNRGGNGGMNGNEDLMIGPGNALQIFPLLSNGLLGNGIDGIDAGVKVNPEDVKKALKYMDLTHLGLSKGIFGLFRKKSTPCPTTTTTTTTTPECFVDDEPKSTVLLAGCDNEISVATSEVFSRGNGFSVPDSPITSCERVNSVFFEVDNAIIMCGGDDVTVTNCFKNTIGSGNWDSFPNLNEHRERFAMASIGKYIAAVGGFKASAEVEVFSDGHWRDGPHI